MKLREYCQPTHTNNRPMKTITKERVTRVIIAVLLSPNRSTERAALWIRLHKLRDSIQ